MAVTPISDYRDAVNEYRLREIFDGPGPYPSFEAFVVLAGVNEFTGPELRIVLRYPLQPAFVDWLDEVTPAAQKRALLLELDANGLDASMGWCHLVAGGPRWPDLPSIRLASPMELIRKAAEASAGP